MDITRVSIKEKIKQIRDSGFEPISITFAMPDAIELCVFGKISEDPEHPTKFRETIIDGVPLRACLDSKESFIAVKLH